MSNYSKNFRVVSVSAMKETSGSSFNRAMTARTSFIGPRKQMRQRVITAARWGTK